MVQFQSPIYGSRTSSFSPIQSFHPCFNPLSTGHAPGVSMYPGRGIPVSIPYLRVTHAKFGVEAIKDKISFNPLSTGHALPPMPLKNPGLQSFNPLSTGHARKIEEIIYTLSMGFQSPIYGSRTSRAGDGDTCPTKFQSPIYGSRTMTPEFIVVHNTAFQSPIYGSRTLYHEIVPIIQAEFQSPIYGSRTRLDRGPLADWYGFQSPIYGSRTSDIREFVH